VKCRLLGWWDGETKRYQLENDETGRLITSRNVCFIEDESPTDPAVIKPEEQLSSVQITDLAPNVAPMLADTTVLVPVENQAPLAPVPASAAPSEADVEELLEFHDAASDVNAPAEDTSTVAVPATQPRSNRYSSLPQCTPSTRDCRQTQFFDSTTQHAFIATTDGDPKTYHEACWSTYWKQWDNAIRAKYEQLLSTGTIEWIQSLPVGRNAVGSKIVFRTKHDGDGNIERHKAQIVAKGFQQVPGTDFDPNATSASVFQSTTFRMFVMILAMNSWPRHYVDFIGAFLHRNLDEEIYLEMPDRVVVKGKEGWYWRIRRNPPYYGVVCSLHTTCSLVARYPIL
jgi:hypothetical protein